MLRSYRSGARLRGLNQLLEYLYNAKNIFDQHRWLTRISFRVSRAREDFEVAIEATLGRSHSVVADQMRDVMEIQFLIRDFNAEHRRIDEWLTATEKDRFNQFRPVVLRQRHTAALGKKPEDMTEALDYKGHSQSVHVTPHQRSFARKGIADDRRPFADDMCLWEMFEHGRRLIWEMDALSAAWRQS
jgi:hypothetical protein